MSLRVKSEIFVSGYLRTVSGQGAFATVARKGDPDAGLIAIKVYAGPQQAKLFQETRGAEGRIAFRMASTDEMSEADIDARLAKEIRFDPDLWIIDVEDREGRDFLGDYLLAPL